MSTTPNMSLIVPEPLVTTGPTYATQINSTLDVIDAHDHSAGKGVRVTPSGLNINADLSFNQNSATNLEAVVLSPQVSVSTNAALYNIGGDLFYRRGDGTQVQITTVAGVNTSGVGGITGLGGTSASASYTNASSLFAWLSAAATFAKQATGDLLIYSRAGAVGVVQAVTLVADVATSAYSLYLPATGPTDNQIMRMKQATAGSFVDLFGTNNQVLVTHNTSNITLSLPQNIHTAATPTFAALTLAGSLSGVTTGAFSGQVNVGSLVSAGAISGTSGTFSGNINLTGAVGSSISAGNYDATFNSVFTNIILPKSGSLTAVPQNLSVAGTFKADTILPYSASAITMSTIAPFAVETATIEEAVTNAGVKIRGRRDGNAPASGYLGQITSFTAGSDQAISAVAGEYDIIAFSVPAGEWNITGNAILHIDPLSAFSGNNTAQIFTINSAISTTSISFDDVKAISSLCLPNNANIQGATFGKVYISSSTRRVRVAASTTYYFVVQLFKPAGSGAAGSKFLAASSVQLERVG